MKYKVYELEDKVTGGGKALKKLVLQGEGKQYPDKNVTMWSDHPLFSTIAVGQTIEAEIQVTDSKTPNPHGGFYKNKVVLKESNVGSKAAPVGASDARTSNVVDFKLLPVVTRLEAALDRLEKVTGFLAGDKQEDDVIIPFADDETMTKNSPF